MRVRLKPGHVACAVTVFILVKVVVVHARDLSTAATIAQATQTTNNTTITTVKECLQDDHCWLQYNFTFDDSCETDCHGEQYVKQTTLNLGKYVGVVLCSASRYQLFMADGLEELFLNVAAGSGTGENWCDVVGGEESLARLSPITLECPTAKGYYRLFKKEKPKKRKMGYGRIQRSDQSSIYYPTWYECGVDIPGQSRVVPLAAFPRSTTPRANTKPTTASTTLTTITATTSATSKAFFPDPIDDCLHSTVCWLKYDFRYDNSWTDCSGERYVRRTPYKVGRYVGVILCSADRYKLLMADELEETFLNIGDEDGAGEDLCELIGGTARAKFAQKYLTSPTNQGFYRSYRGEEPKRGKIGGRPEWTGKYYSTWYECGVQIPGKSRVVKKSIPPSTTNTTLSAVTTAETSSTAPAPWGDVPIAQVKFTEDRIFVVPDGVTRVYVICIGGGGGGHDGHATAMETAEGGDSTFGTYLIARGGKVGKGGHGTIANGGQGGKGGGCSAGAGAAGHTSGGGYNGLEAGSSDNPFCGGGGSSGGSWCGNIFRRIPPGRSGPGGEDPKGRAGGLYGGGGGSRNGARAGGGGGYSRAVVDVSSKERIAITVGKAGIPAYWAGRAAPGVVVVSWGGPINITETFIDQLSVSDSQCADYTFGRGCVGECHCKYEQEICDKRSGTCKSGCAAGWTGITCETACLDFTFGEDCNNNCQCEQYSEVCDKVTGFCQSGCLAGFGGAGCQIELPRKRCHYSKCLGGYRQKAECVEGFCECDLPGYNRFTCLAEVGSCLILPNQDNALATHGTYSGYDVHSCVGSSANSSHEVHVLGIYEPADSRWVTLKITGTTRKPVVLVLTSYESVSWHIQAEPELLVREIKLNSYYGSDVYYGGLTNSSGITVSKSDSPIGWGDDFSGGDIAGLLKLLTDEYGDVASFTGTYRTSLWELALPSVPGTVSEQPPPLTVGDCLSSDACWLKYDFTYDDSWTACSGERYVRRTTYSTGKYIGVILCSAYRYKLVMADGLNETFLNIGDGDGAGEDLCELVGSDQKSAKLSSDFWDSPSVQGYYRYKSGDIPQKGKIGFGPKDRSQWTGKYFPKWYECEVSIPGKSPVVQFSMDNSTEAPEMNTSTSLPAVTWDEVYFGQVKFRGNITFVVPPGVTKVDVICIGGGGGGRDGQYLPYRRTQGHGGNGGDSSFGTYLWAEGGKGAKKDDTGGEGGWGLTADGGQGGIGGSCSAGAGAAGQTSGGGAGGLEAGSSTYPFCGAGGSSGGTPCGPEFRSIAPGSSGPGGKDPVGRHGGLYGAGGGSRAGARAGGGGGYSRAVINVIPGEEIEITVGEIGKPNYPGGKPAPGVVVVSWGGPINPNK